MRKYVSIFIVIGIVVLNLYSQENNLLNFKGEKEKKDYLNFDFSEFKKIKEKIDEGEIKEKEIIYEVPILEEEKETKKEKEKKKKEKKKPPAKKIEIELTKETKLRVLGRKFIGLQYGFYKYLGKEEDRTLKGTPPGATSGLDMKQQLKIQIQGKIANRINVNIDYDDTQDDLNRRKISVFYQGKKNEFIQEARFGDISLSLPKTEFVGYSGAKGLNKQAFGIQLKAKYKKLNMVIIGSQAKGLSEVKKFKGETSFNKKTIPDTSYIAHVYYKIYISTVQLPIERGSEKIYLDDLDATNNEATTLNNLECGFNFFGSTKTFKGDFDLLVPGVDYTLDYQKGIITFRKNIQNNFVIAVDYKDASGNYISDNYNGLPQIIKDETDQDTTELKNRYSIGETKIIRDPTGEKFVLKILDASGNETDENGTPYIDKVKYEVDYDLGIIEFEDEKPFESVFGKNDVYDYTNYGKGRLYFDIYVEYRTRRVSYNLGRINIVRDSEKVIVDGNVLERDKDYFIDYYSGFITFLNEDKINENSDIEITYDYYPFFGAKKNTLAGTRIDFKPYPNFAIGSTLIYNFSPQSQGIPDIRETPTSDLIMELDTKWQLRPFRFFPFKLGLSAELAESIHNPNRSNKAIIENMEGIKQKDIFPTDDELWYPSSIETLTRGELSLTNEDILIKDINSNYSSSNEYTQVLSLNYTLQNSTDEEVGIIYPISKQGSDYSEKEYIEMWVWGDANGEDITIELGSINEDINGNGTLDTEDLNLNGTLDEGEDTGITLENGTVFGKDDGELESEDFDRDGKLDTETDPVFTKTINVNWSGWQKLTYELDINSTNELKWRTVKSLRIRIKGIKGNGIVKIASFGIVGNKWKEGVKESGSFNTDEYLKVDAKNNEDDADYVDLLNNSYYEDLYSQTITESTKEQALSLKYSLDSDTQTNSAAYTENNFSRMDLSAHKKLNFFIYGDDNSEEIFLKFGASKDNYFEFTTTCTWSGWQHFSISLEDTDYNDLPDGFSTKKGNPNLNNITYIQIGIRNNTGENKQGEIWINEIYVSDSMKKQGTAQRGEVSFELPGYFSSKGRIRKIDHEFKSLTFSSQQDKLEKSFSFSWKKFRFFPFSLSYSKNETTTPPENIVHSNEPMAQYLSSWEEGKIIEEKKGVNGSLNIKYLPKLSFNYSQSSTTYTLKGRYDFSESAGLGLNYKFPNLIILPRNITGKINGSRKKTKYNKLLNLIDYEEQTLSWNMSGPFNIFSILNFTPSYKYSERLLKKIILNGDKDDFLPQSKNVEANITMKLNLLKWFSPNLNYNAKIIENYTLPSSTSEWIISGVNFKDINRTGKGSINFPLQVKSILPWIKPLNTLSLRANLGLEDGETFKNVEKSFYCLDKFFLRDKNLKIKTLDVKNKEANLYLLSSRKNQKYNANWNPFSFLNLKGIFLPLKTTKLQSFYTKINERKEQGTITETETLIWPDIKVNINNLEKWLFFSKTANLYGEYRKNRKLRFGIDENLNCHRKYDLRFNITKYQLSLSFSNDYKFTYDIRSSLISNRSSSKKYTAVFKFPPFKKWNLSLNINSNFVRAYNSENTLTSHENFIGLKSQLFSDFMKWKKPIHLPFSKKPIKMAQQVKFNINLDTNFKRSKLNVINTNYNLYKLNFSMDFNISRNFRWTLGSGLTYHDYIKKKANSFIAFRLKTNLQIIF